MDDYKARAKQAIHNFITKCDKKILGPTRRNGSPEDDFCKEKLVPMFKELGWSMQRTESKSTYSQARGRYVSQSVKPGRPDYEGNDSEGRSVFVEAKAPGKVLTIRPNQYDFLIEKIKSGCFAVCVDDEIAMREIYLKWLKLDFHARKSYLTDVLPIPRVKAEEDLSFEDD